MNLYDFDARLYDPYTLRTPTLDPHAEDYPRNSPYSFLDNNPINFLDPTGMDATEVNGGGGSPGMAICPNCPNTPEFQPLIDDPDNVYHYDPQTGKASLVPMLDEVTVTAPRSNTEMSSFDLIMTLPQAGPVIAGGAAAATALTLMTALVFTPAAEAGAGEMDHLERMRAKYIPAPKNLPGFPGAQKVSRKTGRARWKDSNGDILEWDSQHGEVEVYDRQGKHKGAADPETGQVKPDSKVPGRTTEK